MALSAPNLDDRRFQDLVDEAKRIVQRRCPEWTDHNVSDPGVTLIETFAYMVDQLIYRLNRVPEQQYLRYLELMGVRRLAPSAAVAPVTFWLTAPLTESLTVDAGVEVATNPMRGSQPVVFRTEKPLDLAAVEVQSVMSLSEESADITKHDVAIARERPFDAFSEEPRPGDSIMIGLNNAAGRCAVRLSFVIDKPSLGIDTLNPPLKWEALTADGWETCEAEDATSAFTRDGDVVLHVPADHLAADFDDVEAAWLRCSITDPVASQPTFTGSPRLLSVSAATIGGTISAVHGEDIAGEILGVSDGTPSQIFDLEHSPLVRQDQVRELYVSDEENDWTPWSEVGTFAESNTSDLHFIVDEFDGRVLFGPAVRDEDGSVRQFGAVPPAHSRIRIGAYRTGGGVEGNVGREDVTTTRSALPFVARVTNRQPATGGLDAETPQNARERGPLALGTRDRAVTLSDYEYLARASTGEVARAKAIEVTEDGSPAAPGQGVGVQVLIVPTVGVYEPTGFFRYPHLVPSMELRQKVADFLEPRRMVGARVQVTHPLYRRVTVDVHVRRRSDADRDELSLAITQALYNYLSPLTGGPDGDGWPFGRTIHAGELFGVVQRVIGVEYVQGVDLYPLDVDRDAERLPAETEVDMPINATVYSRDHTVFFVGEDD